MLRNLIERYLDNLPNERAFDATFIALLAAEGYSDIHFLHGLFEFGKDFVAKDGNDPPKIQYVFQNKVGDMNISDFRDAKQQMLDAVINPLGHPGLDSALSRKVVLVLTGRLKGTAPVDFQQFADYVQATFPQRSVLLWDREIIIGMMMKHGPEQLFRSGMDVRAYGSFYRLYGDILEQKAATDSIERHFDARLHAKTATNERVAAVTIEAFLFADAAHQASQPHFALQSMLAIHRAVLHEMQQSSEAALADLSTLLRASAIAIVEEAVRFTEGCIYAAALAGGLCDALNGAATFVSYPVLCAQLTDALVLTYELGTEMQSAQAADALCKLVQEEPGCSHPISDRYAVSSVAAVRALQAMGRSDLASRYLKESAIWLIDRYWGESDGLASCDATEADEIRQLLGGAFSGLNIAKESGSLLATALMDSACFIQDLVIYDGLRSDILAAGIVPRYYQVQDTAGQFQYDAEDVIRMPNVEFLDRMPPFETYTHGNHLVGEPQSFKLRDRIPKGAYTAVSLLMRDRYFPTTW